MQRGDVIFGDFGSPNTGANAFDRPAVIWVDDASLPLLVVIPMTSQEKAQRFRSVVRVAPDHQNGLDKPSFALAFQMMPLKRSLVLKPLGKLQLKDLKLIEREVKALVG